MISAFRLLILLIGFGVFVLVLSEKRQADVEVGPRSMLNFVGDTFRELAHVPAAVTPLSDREEIRVGDELARSYETRQPWMAEKAGHGCRVS